MQRAEVVGLWLEKPVIDWPLPEFSDVLTSYPSKGPLASPMT